VGLVSRSGIIPIAASQDTAGPMARSVADAALLLGVLAGYDPEDPATAPLAAQPPPDYRRALETGALTGVRVGVLRHFAGFHEEVDVLFERALGVLRARGAQLIDPAEIAGADKLDADEQVVLAYEFKDGINRYLATRQGSGPRTLAGLIAFNDRQVTREMPFFGQELFVEAQARGPLSDPQYLEAHARALRRARAEGIDAALTKDHLQVLVAPTVGPAWTTDLVNGDHVLGGGVTTPPAVAGYPHITVPMGTVHGLPVGLSFIGAAFTEEQLIGYAYAYEQASHAREPPHFAATLPAK
jgi:amidase